MSSASYLQPAYADYRAAERDSGTSDRKWYQSSKKDKSSKKTREWEKEARAREEAYVLPSPRPSFRC